MGEVVEQYTANSLNPNNNSCGSGGGGGGVVGIGSGSSNNNNNSCSVLSCNFRHVGPTTSNFDLTHATECLNYAGSKNSSFAATVATTTRFDQKIIHYPTRTTCSPPSMISQFDVVPKINNNSSAGNKQKTPSPGCYTSFKSPSPNCFNKLKKPSSPNSCAFNTNVLVVDELKPNFEYVKFKNNNNNNNNTTNANNNNIAGVCHSDYQNFQPKLEKLPTPTTPPTPLSSSGAAALPTTTTTITEEPGIVDCAGCGRKISDRFYLSAVDRKWHATCLQCCQCRIALDGEITCFTRHGNIYCKKDYYR